MKSRPAAKHVVAPVRSTPEVLDAQDHARRALDRTLRSLGLSTIPKFDMTPDDSERSLWVNCRLATARNDYELVYAVLDDQGWRPDRTQLSRFRLGYDVARLHHARTDANIVVIIKVPIGDFAPQEAA